jgi:hypothetical protein
MKKDHIRDYATYAFRFYAQKGGRDKYIKYLIEDLERSAKSSGVSKPTEAALISQEKVIESRKSEFDDIDAVAKTLDMLAMCHDGAFILKAIDYVYFRDCWQELERGSVSDKVHYAEIQIPASERQIYRWLSKARRTFAEERGLRT